ncbi:Response regulator receiver domain-containing protein [Reichenbachiella faecimaris]|uniref:Response regulator receiver domain-containing protein n=1 Tax=Reichenbachiella faecimaris TaxID=692418 RepID=A0A1W2G8D2_REIFA|nr:response regulator [Reichenbachiella faecimaris]SMD32927.1 Response regulator receiver domain-containing protein [Reichenbachiella faecimaris]
MEGILNRTYKDEEVKRFNILYVDDEEVNLRIFQRAFKRHYNVFTAESGFDAIKILEENQIDLIMSDQRMPGMTGVELLIKIVPKYPNIVRMIMTGFSDEDEIIRVDREVGLDRFLVKPWNQEDLKEEFDKALELRNPTEEEKPEPAPAPEVKKETVAPIKPTKQELKKEIIKSVEARKNMMSTVNMDQVIEFNVSLRESLLPRQEELRLYVEDAFVLYEHNRVNHNGYWFGEVSDKLLMTSFNTNSGVIHALTLNTFICATLMELMYKDRIFDPSEILTSLSTRIQNRFFGKKYDENICSVDIALLIYDKQDESLLFGGANHNLYSFSKNGEFKTLSGNISPLIPGVEPDVNVLQFDTFEVSELYFISNNVIDDSTKKSESNSALLSTQLLLEELHKFPMIMQAKLLHEYKYKSLVGVRF